AAMLPAVPFRCSWSFSESFSQREERAVEVALDGIDGQSGDLADLARRQLLLVTERDDEPLMGREAGDERAEAPVADGIDGVSVDVRLGDGIDRDALLPPRPAREVDAAARRHLPQPAHQMSVGDDLAEMPVELEEDILGDLLGARAVVRE